MSPTNPPTPPLQTRPTGDRRHELERIKAGMWPADEPADVRQERIRQAVEALRNLKPWPLTPEEWKLIDQASVLDEDGE